MCQFTGILAAIDKGDPHAAEKLLPLVYDELRKPAAQKRYAPLNPRRVSRVVQMSDS